MNDFTKEELLEIHDGIDDFWRMKPENKMLLAKIQSMIDNYCEHEWNNSCCGCSISSIFCDKCEKTMKSVTHE